MNKIYKVLWNHSTQNWVVTSELSRGHVKSSSSNETNTQQKSKLQKRISLLAMAIMGIFSLLSTPVNASGETPVNASGETSRDGVLIRSYFDNNGNGKYDPGIDDLISEAPLYNGTNGSNGADGKSSTAPTIEVGEKTPEGETTITIKNPDGTSKKVIVKDGKDGKDGKSPTIEVGEKTGRR